MKRLYTSSIIMALVAIALQGVSNLVLAVDFPNRNGCSGNAPKCEDRVCKDKDDNVIRDANGNAKKCALALDKSTTPPKVVCDGK